MGKRRGARQARAARAESDDDAASIVSYGSTAASSIMSVASDVEDEDHSVEEDTINAIDNLLEKRSSTRDSALQFLLRASLQLQPRQTLEDRYESVIENLLICLRKPSVSEAAAGSRILAIFSLLLGPEAAFLYDRCEFVLLGLTKRHDVGGAAALRALATVCSVWQSHKAEWLLEMCEEFLNPSSSTKVLIAALESWSYTTAILPKTFVASVAYSRLVETERLQALLDHESLDVRAAAGANIALILELRQNANLDVDSSLLDYIIDKLTAITSQSSKSISKKEKKEQRSIFRRILASVETEEHPEESISLRTETLVFRGWGEVLEIEFLKSILQSGFQTHLQYSENLRAQLQLGHPPEAMERLTGLEKRSLLSKNSISSKQRTADLAMLRRKKDNQRSAFLDE